MSYKEIVCDSQAKVVATTSATWNIAEWEGPIQNLVRSQASCFLSVGEFPEEAVDLRFYLRYVENQKNPLFDPDSPMCKTKAKFSGYSLMMDLLSDHKEKLMISVNATREKPEKDTELATSRGAVAVEPNLSKSGIEVIKAFFHCETWNEDKNGNQRKYEMLDKDTYDADTTTSDAKFILTITLYKMENTRPDAPTLKQCQPDEVSDLAYDLATYQFDPDNYSDVVLTSKDGITIRAHRFILAARSPYFRRLLKSDSTSVSLDVDATSLLALLHWIYTGVIQVNSGFYLRGIVTAAGMFEMSGILNMLDSQFIKYANTENMFALAELAKAYKMINATDDMVKFIKCNISDWQNTPYPDECLVNSEEIIKQEHSTPESNANLVEPKQVNEQPKAQKDFISELSSPENSENHLPESEEHQYQVEAIDLGETTDTESNTEQEKLADLESKLFTAKWELKCLNDDVQKLFSKKSNSKKEIMSDSQYELLKAKWELKDLNEAVQKLFPEKDQTPHLQSLEARSETFQGSSNIVK